MNANYAWRVFLVSVSLFVLTACHSSTDNDEAQTPFEGAATEVNASLPFQGKPITAREAKDIQDEFGCRHEAPEVSDNRSGDFEIWEMRISTPEDLTLTTLKKTYLRSDEENHSQLQTKLLSISNNAQGELLASPFDYTSTCQSNPSSEETFCSEDEQETKVVQNLKQHLRSGRQLPKKSLFSTCTLGSVESKQVNYEIGTYTLRNGQIIEALREISQMTGVIVCGGHRFRHGSMTSDRIFTKDLVSIGPQRACEGTLVSFGQTYRLDDGTVISSQRSEVLEAPHR
jgi:hypothetical protein